MITSRGVSPLKLLLLSLGILLYFRNDQLITLSQKDQVAEESVQDQQVGEDMKERRELLRRTCSKYGQRLKVPLKLYNKKLRLAEREYLEEYLEMLAGSILSITWCTARTTRSGIISGQGSCQHTSLIETEIIIDWNDLWQIGSSTWATHLLKMNNIPIFRRTPIHIVTRKHFPPLLGRNKQEFLKTAEALIVARDPFERLLSSFTVSYTLLTPSSQISVRTSWTWPTGPTCPPGTRSVTSRESSGTGTGRRRGLALSQPSRSSSNTWWGSL